MPFSYANPTSGPSAGEIGWFVFDTFDTIQPGETITGLTGTLNNGATVTFDLTATHLSGTPCTFDAAPLPVNPDAAFGTSGYTGISGAVGLTASLANSESQNQLTLSNIVVLDHLGNPVPSFTAVVADTEVIDGVEHWVWNTDGGVWAQLSMLGSGASPTLSGLGTTTVTLTGGLSPTAVSYVLTTQDPTQLQLTTGISTATAAAGREAVAIGFATNYIFTVDPVVTAAAEVNSAQLVLTKSADKPISYLNDIITYQVAVKNMGNIAADNVVLTDLLPTGVSYVAGTLVVSVPYSGTLASGLALAGSMAAGGIVTLSFKVRVDAMPNPNPIVNKMTAAYTYRVDPAAPDMVAATAASNAVSTLVFRYNFSQQISDLIESVALEQAALAAIAQAEGAKIQKIVAMGGVTTQALLCLNKSVADMLDSIAMLEAILKQKLSIVDCQISGLVACM